MTEREWQAQVVQLARTLGWDHIYHTHDSRSSEPGFPDLVLVRERVVYLELKTDTGKLSAAQEGWIAALVRARAEVYVCRPMDLPRLAKILARTFAATACPECGLVGPHRGTCSRSLMHGGAG